MIESGEMRQCDVCKNIVKSQSIVRCPVCLKNACPDCAVKGFGQKFCSHHCLDFYMYPDDEEDDEEEE